MKVKRFTTEKWYSTLVNSKDSAARLKGLESLALPMASSLTLGKLLNLCCCFLSYKKGDNTYLHERIKEAA